MLHLCVPATHYMHVNVRPAMHHTFASCDFPSESSVIACCKRAMPPTYAPAVNLQ
jgi:hypothetical protein